MNELLYEMALTSLRCHAREFDAGASLDFESIARDAVARMKARPSNKHLLIAHLHCGVMDAVDAYKAARLG